MVVLHFTQPAKELHVQIIPLDSRIDWCGSVCVLHAAREGWFDEKNSLAPRLCVCHSTNACDGKSSKTRVGLDLSVPVVGACVGENTHSSCYVSADDLSFRRVESLTPTSMQCCELHTRHSSSASLWIQSSCKVRELLYVAMRLETLQFPPGCDHCRCVHRKFALFE